MRYYFMPQLEGYVILLTSEHVYEGKFAWHLLFSFVRIALCTRVCSGASKCCFISFFPSVKISVLLSSASFTLLHVFPFCLLCLIHSGL
jgi:hypothetical protein